VETPFETLKEVLCTAPILSYPQPRERFLVDTDSSNVGIEGVISQVQEEQERVIAYYNKTLNKVKKNYYVTQRELFAVVRTLELFHNYFYGLGFHLRTANT
jgi:hypothetical protein